MKSKKSRGCSGVLGAMILGLAIFLVLAAGAYMILTIVQPDGSFVFHLSPPTEANPTITLVPSVTVVDEPVILPPETLDATATSEEIEPTATNALPTSTPEPVLPTPTEFVYFPPTATEFIPPSDFLFSVHEGSPTYLESTLFRPALNCNFLGIAGQIFDRNGAPLVQQDILLFLDEEVIQRMITGRADLSMYGPAAFEFILSDTPARTTGLYSLQVVDQQGIALSDIIPIETYDDCSANLVLVNFVQNR
ncbi:MAG: hypothetical protein JXA19_06690 [Anaerolineales bacterium]|nr:hypothetical protein [Anaerolineales bacterium]